MLGDRFATISGTDDSAYRFVEEIMRSGRTQAAPGDDNSDQQELQAESDVGDKKLELRLLMLLKDFDDKLLREAIKIISS